MRIIFVEPQSCLTCHSCTLACSLSHASSQDLLSVLLAGEVSPARIFIVAQGNLSGIVTCRHCLSPPCLKACPTQAIQRNPRTGAVIINEELCIGCRDCLVACPFGAIILEAGKAIKCDLCQGDPACVKVCPTKAIQFLDTEEEVRARRQRAISKLFPQRRAV